jgi:hypothetical protein
VGSNEDAYLTGMAVRVKIFAIRPPDLGASAVNDSGTSGASPSIDVGAAHRLDVITDRATNGNPATSNERSHRRRRIPTMVAATGAYELRAVRARAPDPSGREHQILE